VTSDRLVAELRAVLDAEPLDLARAALVVAKIEYPRLDPEETIAKLDALGAEIRSRVAARHGPPVAVRVAELNYLLFSEHGFAGNRRYYGDFRNSLLNVVVERRTGIPISLGLVYMEVARRADVEVFGVSFPGHFLLRVPADAGDDTAAPIILDPFNGGRRLDDDDCRALLQRQVGDEVQFERSFLGPCTGRQLLARMLNNLKRTYVELRSYPQARAATELLLTVEPAFGAELRDRGLIAYHLDDYPSALRDLEHYLKLRTWGEDDRDEHERVVAHVKTLRGRVAGLN
jgi:regulator of sirC expression with transglutaminase-like and TPR domain